MRRDGTISWEHVRHEEAAGFAAAAEAALTGSWRSVRAAAGRATAPDQRPVRRQPQRRPVLAIAAHIPAEEIGGMYFQETHPAELFRECSVYCELVSTPAHLPRILQIAMRRALARGGVAVVVVPGGTFLDDARGAREWVSAYQGHVVDRAGQRCRARGRGFDGERGQRGDDLGQGQVCRGAFAGS